MVRFPSLEYSLSHPHPKGHWFLLATLVIFLLTLPVLILVNLITQGSELVPSLQSQYQPDETLLSGWWGEGRLPSFFRPKAPRCQPKDIGRGDTFRLTTSLFDYTVMSTLNNSQAPGTPQVPEQIRAVYKGQSFSNCTLNSARFDYSLFEQTQSVMVGVLCKGFPEPSVDISMQTTMTFAWELSKDFIGQYYGPGLDLMNINDTTASDYRRVVLAVLQVISTDSLTITHKPLLSDTAGSITIVLQIDPDTGKWFDGASTLTYVNGTQPDPYPEEASIYIPGITNLMTVAMDAVYLDLGSNRYPNLYKNVTRLGKSINPNLPPEGINSSNWAEGSQTFHYGRLSGYDTWADTLLHGQPVQVGNLTGLPTEGPFMATTYLCPSYQQKPTNSLLSSVFIGSATMTLSVWGVWMFFTAFVAKKMMAPRVQCECEGCKKRLADEQKQQEEEERKEAENQAKGGMFARFRSLGRKKSPARSDEEQPNSGDLPYSEAVQRPGNPTRQTTESTVDEKRESGVVSS